MEVDYLNLDPREEAKKHKLKRLVQGPNSFFMDVRCPGCLTITTIFSHAQTAVICGSCNIVLSEPTGGRCKLTKGCSFRKKVMKMYYTDRDVLLTEHFKLQKDINDIQSQIRKLEKSNQILDQQNQHLKMQLESRYGTNDVQREFVKQNYFTNTGLSKFLDKQYLMEKLNKASEICEVATGEILKHAKYVADGVSYKLLNNNVLSNAFLADNLSNNLLRTNLLSNNFHPNTFMQSGLNNNFNKLDSIMGDTVTTNLSSNESNEDPHLVLTSDEESVFTNQVKHTDKYEFN